MKFVSVRKCVVVVGTLKPPLSIKIVFGANYLQYNLELCPEKFPSILDTDKFFEVNFIDVAWKLTPTESENCVSRFSTFRIF